MIFTQNPNDFWHKRKIDNFDPYNVLLAIATNIPMRFMIDFVVKGHIFYKSFIALDIGVNQLSAWLFKISVILLLDL